MSVGTQSVVFNAVPLLVLAAAYAVVSAAVLPRLWRMRRSAAAVDIALAAIFPCLAITAAVFGAVVVHDEQPIGGHVWPPFAAALLALVPAVIFFTGWRDRELVLTGPRMREAEAEASARDRELDAIGKLAGPLARAADPSEVARVLLDEVVELLGVEFAGLALIDDEGREARGLLARGPAGDLDWWRSVRIDLAHEPSGIASAFFEAAPVAVYDAEASPKVSRRLAAAVGAKSALFVPLVAAERVAAVLSLATTSERHVFTPDELRLASALTAEAAQALERVHSAAALADALARERVVGEIARRVRAELDPREVARIAVVETGQALGLSRCFIRLGSARTELVLEAEWHEDGLPPIDAAERLPASNLAARERRTVVIDDVERSAELADPELGGPEALLEIGTRAALATPIVVFDRAIGIFALHRPTPQPWTQAEIVLAETLAREVGLALHTARLLAENERRLAQQRALIEAANDVAGELEVEIALQRLVDEVAGLVGGEAAVLCLHDAERQVLRVAAVHGLPPEIVGLEFPDDRGIAGQSVHDRRSILENDLPRLEQPIPHPAFAEYTHAICTPLSWSGVIRGSLLVSTGPAGRRFGPDDLDVLEAFGNLAAVALRNASLLGENRAAVEQQKALVGAAQAMTAELSPETVLQRLVAEVTELVAADAADCYLYDAERDVLRCAAVHGLPAELLGLEFRPAGNVRAALVAQAPAVSSEDRERRDPVPHPAYEEFERTLVAPMTWGGVTRGLLGVGTRHPQRRFTAADAEALQGYATLGSLALRNAQAFSERTRQARIERGFYRIAAVLGEPLSLQETLDAVAQAASEALGGAFAAVLVPVAEALELAGSHGLPEALRAGLAGGLPESAAVLAACARDRRVLAAPAAAADERFGAEWHGLAAAAGFESLLAIPVESPRTAAGALVVVFFESAREFADDDLELAQQLARAARGALERSELFENERTSRALSQQLARTGSQLATELEPGAVLDEVVEQALPLLRADACTVRLLRGDQLVVEAAAGPGLAELVDTAVPSTAPVAGDVLQTRAPVAIANAGGAALREGEPALGRGFAGYLGVPLFGAEAGPHGVLAVLSRRPRAWRPEEIDALAALAGNAATAVSNAELYQRVALERQQSFAILANIADGIVAVDRKGAVVLWNSAAERITGVPAEEALERQPAQILGRDLSTGELPQGDRLVSIHRGGEEVWLSLTEAIMRDPAGAVAGRIYAFRDISTERIIEQMKSDFVSTVSEQLRRPLTSIYGFAETLLREDVQFDEPARRTFLGYIASESERLTEIVDALLNVARLDAGDLQITIVPTDVVSVVNEVVASVAESASGNGHNFVVDLPSGRLDAQADADKLRQILQNLVDNAVKFSPQGGTVTVGARRKGETVEVRVVDEGIGIPAAEQQRIFGKFVRGVRGDGGGGTGLGLFIAQGLVTAMGGRIWVTSEEGAGSSFVFELPLAAA